MLGFLRDAAEALKTYMTTFEDAAGYFPAIPEVLHSQDMIKGLMAAARDALAEGLGKVELLWKAGDVTWTGDRPEDAVAWVLSDKAKVRWHWSGSPFHWLSQPLRRSSRDREARGRSGSSGWWQVRCEAAP